MEPFFSIIIPVYNVEMYLKECYLSILNQNFCDYEILFIDDGSTDSSGIICDQICKKTKGAITIHKVNGGLSDARNIGINLAKGKYIVFVDSDDMLHSGGLRGLHDLIVSKGHPDVIINRIKNFTDEDKIGKECKYRFSEELQQMPISDSFQHLIKLDDYIPGAWTIVAKRAYIVENELLFVKRLLHEDEQWTPRAILRAKSLAFNNSCLYLYRQGRIGSITQMKNVKREIDKLWIVESLYKESKNMQYTTSCSIALVERAADLYWGVLIRTHQYTLKYYEYEQLVDKLSSEQHIFELSKKKKYIICNLFLNIFGIKNMSVFFNKLISIKG
jgi:glycosyltransferase involved in cell wall biosynthesis